MTLMELPQSYKEKMKNLLNDEYSDYIDSFSEKRYNGIRVNTLKITPEHFKELYSKNNDIQLEQIPWCHEGFYFDTSKKPAKHPYYYAGLFYIQEPSAMAPASIMDIKPGDKVLDLCAAPGGKSTHLGSKLNKTGILVSNDISVSRTKASIKNIELFGITNAIVTSETPDKLSTKFDGFFDKIIVDAPCSGEGMFRKEPSIIKDWIKYGEEYYQNLQREILPFAEKMLKPGGKIVYSTCTFSPLENEQSVEYLINLKQNFSLLPIDKTTGFCDGHPEWADGNQNLKKCARLWPHKIKGEGHFVAYLQKKYDDKFNNIDIYHNEIRYNKIDITTFNKFCDEVLSCEMSKNIKVYNNKVYSIPEGLPDLSGLRVLRQGWLLGELKKNRFEPSQSFALGLNITQVKKYVNFSLNDERVIKYLKGETLKVDGDNGWNLICVDGFPLGWAKITKGVLKNKYLKGWRWM